MRMKAPMSMMRVCKVSVHRTAVRPPMMVNTAATTTNTVTHT